MSPRPLYSPRLRRALLLAEQAHRGQRRKGGDTPYVVHPIAVAAALAAAGAGEDLVCAGYLHDAVEDADVTLGDVARALGERVAELVAAVTEEKRDPRTGEDWPWERRKERSLAHLRATVDPDVAALKGADLLVNVTDILLDHATSGDDVWLRFRRGRDAQLDYYGEAAALVLARLELPALGAQLEDARERLLALR